MHISMIDSIHKLKQEDTMENQTHWIKDGDIEWYAIRCPRNSHTIFADSMSELLEKLGQHDESNAGDAIKC